MKVKLPSGKEIRLGVAHIQTNSPEPVPHIRRGTKAWVSIDDVELHAISICRPPDQFSKAEGRRTAANKLLAKLRAPAHPLFSKEDRREVFFRICPEYAPKMTKKEMQRWSSNGYGKVERLRGVLCEVSSVLGVWIDTGFITNRQPLENIEKVLKETE